MLLGLEIAEVVPAVLNELNDGVGCQRNRERRKRDREPAVGRAQKHGPRFFRAAGVEVVDVGMSASATRQVLAADFPEGLRHAAGGAALVALDPKVLGLERCVTFIEAQRAFAAGRAVMNEVVP